MFGVSRRFSRKFSRNSSTSSLNSEKSRKISRSETSLIVRKRSSTTSSCFNADGEDLDVHLKEEYNTHRKQQRRKDGLSAFMPQMYSELTKFLAQTRRKHNQKEESDRWKYDDNKTVLLRYAVRSFDLQRVVQLLEANQADVNEANKRGITALHEAAIDGNYNCLKILLDHNADINQTDNEGFTCLDYAVYGGNYDCAAYLIERGANTDTIKDGLLSFSPTLHPKRTSSDVF